MLSSGNINFLLFFPCVGNIQQTSCIIIVDIRIHCCPEEAEQYLPVTVRCCQSLLMHVVCQAVFKCSPDLIIVLSFKTKIKIANTQPLDQISGLKSPPNSATSGYK